MADNYKEKSTMNDLTELMVSLHRSLEPNIRAATEAVNQTCAAMAPQIREMQRAAGQAMAAFAKTLPPLPEVPRG